MPEVIYRKYRPRSFSEVVGQRHIAAVLEKPRWRGFSPERLIVPIWKLNFQERKLSFLATAAKPVPSFYPERPWIWRKWMRPPAGGLMKSAPCAKRYRFCRLKPNTKFI